MRLLNVKTLDFEDFIGEIGDGIPLYAVLSHTWGAEEVSHKEYLDKKNPSKSGYDKIHGCCKLAASEGFQYVWIDTCCIDKSSSAELSEAINSMFQWYRDAGICYAYLSDVDSSEDPMTEASSFTRSRWFTRGWTLQELLAPAELVFLGSDWVEIGTKKTLRSAVSRITRISQKVLDECCWAEYSVAQKMSWAAGRRSTRLEDEAYCLMGLFDVNMPLLYGEGRKAFSRLQQEILKQSDDQSIFAWSYPEEEHSHTQVSGLIAPSPEYFKDASSIELLRQEHGKEYENPFQVVNRLIRVRLRLLDHIKAIKLRRYPTMPPFYNVIEIQQDEERSLVKQSTPPSPPDVQREKISEEVMPAIQTYHQFSMPIITIEGEKDASQLSEDGLKVSSDFLNRTIDAPGSSRNTESPLLDSHIQELSLKPDEAMGLESWRWYIYEPALIVPLNCHISGRQLGILFSKGSTKTERNDLLRLHNPSIVSIAVKDSQRRPFLTVYVPIATETENKLNSLSSLGRLQWPEIRIAPLLSAGYTVHPDCGLGWKFDRTRAALVQNSKFLHETDMIDYAPFVLFYRISRISVASSIFFFISIPVSQRSSLTCEIGVYATGATSLMALDYSLYSFDLARDRRAEVSLGNGQAVVVKYREGRGISFVNVSIENLNRVTEVGSVPHDAAKTDFLSSRLFPMLRSLR